MAHELPAALGIRMHEGPDAEVLVVIGDGSLLMGPGELATRSAGTSSLRCGGCPD